MHPHVGIHAEHVWPAEPVFADYLRENGEHAHPPLVGYLKSEVRKSGP